MNSENSNIQFWFKGFGLSLLFINIIGVIMVYSSSYIYAKELHDNSAYFFIRQLIFLSVGVSVAFVISKTRFSFWNKYSYWINGLVTIALILTFVPGFGVEVKGASRWINIWGFSLQPGEVLKYTLLLSSLSYFEGFHSMQRRERTIFALLLLFPLALVLRQPDYGTFMICFIGVLFTCYLSSFPRKIFYSMIPVGALVGIALLVAQPYRVARLKTFLDPWESPQGSGFQIIQSWMAFASGGVIGKGLGNSNEKLFYLPEAHNDFIFSVLGEELGFLGVLMTVLLFLGLIFFGLKMMTEVKERMAALMGSAAIFTLGFQALLNMGVVLGLLPTKGLNLPFVSYGGSSLVSNFFAVGLVLCVYNHQRWEDEKLETVNDHLYTNPHRVSETQRGQDLFSHL